MQPTNLAVDSRRLEISAQPQNPLLDPVPLRVPSANQNPDRVCEAADFHLLNIHLNPNLTNAAPLNSQAQQRQGNESYCGGGYSTYTLKNLHSKLSHIWGIVGDWALIPLGRGYYNIQLPKMEDRNKILDKRTWILEPGLLRTCAKIGLWVQSV